MANPLTTSERAGQLIARAGKYVGDLVSGDFNPVLEANKQINKISGFHKAGMALASPIEMISRWGHQEGGLTDAFANTFMVNAGKEGSREWAMSNIRKGKLAGGISGIGIMAATASGLTHDSAGNADIAGLPGI